MRIGMILDFTFPPDPRVENEAISLIKDGHKIFLFCLKYGNEPSNEVINGIQVCRYKTNKLEYKLSALAYTVPFYTNIMQQKISHFIEAYKIEALHIHDMRIAGAVFKANKKRNLPTVLDLHDNVPEIMQFYPHVQKFPGKQLISSKKWQRKEEEFIEKTTTIVVTSPEHSDEIVTRTKISKEKIYLVPNTVRQSFYKEATIDASIVERYKNNFVLLYLGNTGLRRGLLGSIGAVNLLKEEIPTIKLVIVGASSADATLKKKVADLKLESYVDFEGWQDVSLFPSYIVASKVGISPLHKNKHHDAAYANKIFQYMSFGIPVVVSNCTAQQKVIKTSNSGLVFEAENTQDFADKIRKLHASNNLSKAFGKNGERFIREEFNWERTSKSLLEMYATLKL